MAPFDPVRVRSFQRLSMTPLLLFIALQICDALTTLTFLRQGIAEANPLIRLAIGVSHSPELGLLGVKAAGCAMAWVAWRTDRRRLLARANGFFAACVVWNLVAISAA